MVMAFGVRRPVAEPIARACKTCYKSKGAAANVPQSERPACQSCAVYKAKIEGRTPRPETSEASTKDK